jgi:hypothetical protein
MERNRFGGGLLSIAGERGAPTIGPSRLGPFRNLFGPINGPPNTFKEFESTRNKQILSSIGTLRFWKYNCNAHRADQEISEHFRSSSPAHFVIFLRIRRAWIHCGIRGCAALRAASATSTPRSLPGQHMLSNHDLEAFIEQLRNELADINESIAALELYQEKLRSKPQGRTGEKTRARPRTSERSGGSSVV